jgi:predicted kinase
LKFYPNPNSGSATIAYELAGETAALWQLFDVNGRKVMQLNLPVGTQQQQLDLSGLSNGVYHFTVSLAQERLQSGKMVITGK